METLTGECAHCENPIIGEPIRDPEQTSWLGSRAETFCSPGCLNAAAEDRNNHDVTSL